MKSKSDTGQRREPRNHTTTWVGSSSRGAARARGSAHGASEAIGGRCTKGNGFADQTIRSRKERTVRR
jgi:hypothetical protein